MRRGSSARCGASCSTTLIVVGERHLLRAVREYVAYYNGDRPHMSLGGDAPVSRPVEPPARGRIVAMPRSEGCTTATPGLRDRRTRFSPPQVEETAERERPVREGDQLG